ncbi:guanine deaminase [Camponotus floridanus]|uniref:guanine deaminase n=1 Tax=Camponotus floridanus TaxID=104421 RepID=UPI000DC67EF9|nr:guanine deaminase [Camponotus floridanus]
MPRQIFIGSMIHADENEEVIFKKNVTILVDDGKIIDVMENPDQQKIDNFHADEVNNLSSGQFIIPGFIDCHTHAVQFPNLGLGFDKTLLDWLETYTFPLERQYTDQEFAEKVFEIVVKETIFNGTTTACYFASLYTEASAILAQKCSDLGQRAFIGKINMNAPRDDGYYESTEKSIETTKAFIEAVEKIGNPLVQPIITPRFALSCDMELMKKLANIAKEKDLRIQSHVSENKDEVKAVKEKFGKAYTNVYDTVGLLTNKTILAHGIYLEDSELDILAKRGTAIIHCPCSNINLKSGLCDVRKIKDKNIVVGLGTDVSGGSNYSFLGEIRSALHVSISLHLTGDDVPRDYVPLDYKDFFIMATLGGAKALSIEDKVGNLLPGKEFDALIIDLNAEHSFLNNFREYTLEENLQRFIYSGNDRNIVSVYVKGRKVKMTDVAPATCEGLVEQEVIEEVSEALIMKGREREHAKEDNKEWNLFICYKSCLVRENLISWQNLIIRAYLFIILSY